MVAVLGLHYADQNVPGRLDRSLDALIRYQLRGYQPATRVLVTLGNPAQIAILIAIVAGGAALVRSAPRHRGNDCRSCYHRGDLKPLIGRLRFGALPFPSGHTTAVATVATAPRFSSERRVAPQCRATPARWRVLVAIPVGVGLSLVAQHVHYLTDAVAGYCVAVATVLAVALGLDYWCAARRRWGRRPGRIVGEHGR